MNLWRPILHGFEANVGSEQGIVRLDEEHPNGARITIEEGGVTAPWSITCGIYGWMAHTTFCGSEREARETVLTMKERLITILDAIAADAPYDRICVSIGHFVADF